MLKGDTEFGNLEPKESTVNTLSLLAVPRLEDLDCVPKEVDPLLKNPGEPTIAWLFVLSNPDLKHPAQSGPVPVVITVPVVNAPALADLDNPDVTDEEDALLLVTVETFFTDPVEPRSIELEGPLVKLDEPDVNLNPLDELEEESVAADDPLVDPVFNNAVPLPFNDDIVLKVAIRLPLAELEELEPDPNVDPLDETIEEPADAEDDPLVAPAVVIKPLLAELEIPVLTEPDEPRLPVEENPE